MTDIVDKKTRSRMMSGIKGMNKKPGLLVRKGLYSRGYRYKLHDKNLPGNLIWYFPNTKPLYRLMVVFAINIIAIYLNDPKAEMNFGRQKYWR
jgi:DNA mismatch endonuclease, patch repair protein